MTPPLFSTDDRPGPKPGRLCFWAAIEIGLSIPSNPRTQWSTRTRRRGKRLVPVMTWVWRSLRDGLKPVFSPPSLAILGLCIRFIIAGDRF